jgi:hypothetical protein
MSRPTEPMSTSFSDAKQPSVTQTALATWQYSPRSAEPLPRPVRMYAGRGLITWSDCRCGKTYCCCWLGPTARFSSDPLLTQSRRVQAKSRRSMWPATLLFLECKTQKKKSGPASEAASLLYPSGHYFFFDLAFFFMTLFLAVEPLPIESMASGK